MQIKVIAHFVLYIQRNGKRQLDLCNKVLIMCITWVVEKI